MQVEELKVEMIRRNVTQKQIAKITQKTEATICKYFYTGDMSIIDAKIISDYLGLSLERRAEIFLK